MLHSLLVICAVIFRVANHLFDPSSIRTIPVDLVSVLLKKRFQGTIFDAIIAAQLKPPLLDPSTHDRRAGAQFAAQFPLTMVGLVACSQTFFPNLAPHG